MTALEIRYKHKFLVPNTLSLLRVPAAVILFLLISIDQIGIALFVFLLTLASDALDGHIARKIEVCSTLGGYLDATADFSVVSLALLAYILQSIYPYWMLLLVLIMFTQFLVTSQVKKPIYDPIGKYYGTFVMGIVGFTLLDCQSPIVQIIPLFLLSFTILSIVSRIYAISRTRRITQLDEGFILGAQSA